MMLYRASRVAPMVQNSPAIAGDVRDVGSIPGWGRPPGGGHGNPVQYSCLENPMNRGAWPGYSSMSTHWLTAVHRVTKNRMLLNDGVNTHIQIIAYTCVRNFHVKGSGI